MGCFSSGISCTSGGDMLQKTCWQWRSCLIPRDRTGRQQCSPCPHSRVWPCQGPWQRVEPAKDIVAWGIARGRPGPGTISRSRAFGISTQNLGPWWASLGKLGFSGTIGLTLVELGQTVGKWPPLGLPLVSLGPGWARLQEGPMSNARLKTTRGGSPRNGTETFSTTQRSGARKRALSRGPRRPRFCTYQGL